MITYIILGTILSITFQNSLKTEKLQKDLDAQKASVIQPLTQK